MRTLVRFLLIVPESPDLAHAPNQAPTQTNDKSWFVPIVVAIITAIATVVGAFVTAQSKQPPISSPPGISATAAPAARQP
jgi:flagellar basal body-associated protein FliL